MDRRDIFVRLGDRGFLLTLPAPVEPVSREEWEDTLLCDAGQLPDPAPRRRAGSRRRSSARPRPEPRW
ncbi:MAG TPA: hypothetical protein VNO70_26805 [Blastocatellia bacterium]|nr:hypothetical protein [Blastocatellia bacterium]